MAGKLALVFLVFFVAAQCSTALPRERRDTTEVKKDADPLANIQNYLKENLQWDKVVDNLKDFGDKISSGTKEFADTVQKKAEEIFTSNKDAPAKTK